MSHDGGHPYRIEGIDHVQLAMPPGPEAEAAAEAFFAGLLRLCHGCPKPPELAVRGGCWFERAGPRSTSGWKRTSGRPGRPTPPWPSPGSTHCARCSNGSGHPVRRTEDMPGRPQWYVDDPFGNRIELLSG